MDKIKGYIMEPQNFSVNDGEGIRTIIFLAGCPLRCQWCSNPESHTTPSKIAHYEASCIKCGNCSVVCSEGVGINLNDPLERNKCTACGTCVNVCPTGSRKDLVYECSSDEIMEVIEKQRIFYRYSGGGVTFSGGEATVQRELLEDLVNRLYDKALDLAIETSGYFEFEEVKNILSKMNLIFVDIKHMDDDKHKFHTGVGNKKILENISRLKELKVPVVVRIPVIEGVNSDEENIRETAKFVKANLVQSKIELLPYHSFGDSKYEALGLEKPSREFKRPWDENIKKLERIIEEEGVRVVSFK